MIIAPYISQAQELISQWRRAGYRISLVPTMGYFHDGHLALMRMARKLADKVVVSHFVNPAQFSPDEDLAVYPRDFEGDCQKAEATGVDMLFCPEAKEMYPPNYQTTITVAELGAGLCGKDRPGHFTGVATVVTKLIHIIQPHSAIFGEKDFQQLILLQQMVKDLNMAVEIVGHPIVREADGLAMSSRNALLSERERESALVLYRALSFVKNKIQRAEGKIDVASLIEAAAKKIEAQQGCTIDYLTIIDADTLHPCNDISGACRVLGAIKLSNRVRLLDNMELQRPSAAHMMGT